MMKCLQWFKALIADRQFDSLQEEFRILSKERGGYFMPKPPYYDFNDESIFYVDLEIDGQMLSSGFPFSEFVEKRIEKEANETMFCISKEVGELSSKEKAELCASLISQISTLIYINEKSDILGKREHLTSVLNNIRDFLNGRAQGVTQNVLDEDYLGDTFFGFKGKVFEAKKLYKVLEETGLLDPDNNQFNDFYKILIISTSTMLVNLHTPLKVNCTNYKAAYIFRSMESVFSRLSFRNIGKSELIFKKSGRPFTEGDLSKALSIFLEQADIDPHDKDEIDKTFAPLINKR